MKPGMELITEERKRQIESEGWTLEHDDEHLSGELGRAGSCYENAALTGSDLETHVWPWSSKWWKPKDKLQNLIRAGALFLAESEKQKRLGDWIKSDYWSQRAEIVGRAIDKLNPEPSTEQSGGTESQDEIVDELEELRLYKHACNESIAHLDRELILANARIEELTQWKETQIKLWLPVIEFMQENSNMKWGDSISEEVLKRLKETNDLYSKQKP